MLAVVASDPQIGHHLGHASSVAGVTVCSARRETKPVIRCATHAGPWSALVQVAITWSSGAVVALRPVAGNDLLRRGDHARR